MKRALDPTPAAAAADEPRAYLVIAALVPDDHSSVEVALEHFIEGFQGDLGDLAVGEEHKVAIGPDVGDLLVGKAASGNSRESAVNRSPGVRMPAPAGSYRYLIPSVSTNFMKRGLLERTWPLDAGATGDAGMRSRWKTPAAVIGMASGGGT